MPWTYTDSFPLLPLNVNYNVSLYLKQHPSESLTRHTSWFSLLPIVLLINPPPPTKLFYIWLFTFCATICIMNSYDLINKLFLNLCEIRDQRASFLGYLRITRLEWRGTIPFVNVFWTDKNSVATLGESNVCASHDLFFHLDNFRNDHNARWLFWLLIFMILIFDYLNHGSSWTLEAFGEHRETHQPWDSGGKDPCCWYPNLVVIGVSLLLSAYYCLWRVAMSFLCLAVIY